MRKLNALRRWYLIHKWTSLICTIFLLLLCLTGLLLIFGEEIAQWTGMTVEPPNMTVGLPRTDLDAIVADARARRPQDFVTFVSQDEKHPAWVVSMADRPDALEESAVYMYDAHTGAMLQDFPLRQGFMYVMLKLHVDLFADLPGTLFLGAMGLLFVTSVVSGVVVYGPFMRRLPFGIVRHEGSRRLIWLDLHNLLGIVTVRWVLVVGITGVINTLARPIFAQWQNTELADMTAEAQGKPALTQFSSFQRAVEISEVTQPDIEVGFVVFPGTSFAGPHHYAVFMRGKTPLTARLITPIVIDAETGTLAASRARLWNRAAKARSGWINTAARSCASTIGGN